MSVKKNNRILSQAKELRRSMTPHERKLWYLFPSGKTRIRHVCPGGSRGGKGLCRLSRHVRHRLSEGAGAGGEVGLLCGRHHADALQGQPAIPHSRADLPLCRGPRHLGASCLSSSSWAIWPSIQSGLCSPMTRFSLCAACLSLSCGWIIATERVTRSASSMNPESPRSE